MSDLYELQLTWELGDALPRDILDSLRWHLGLPQTAGSLPDDGAAEEPLLASRGPALRIGGTLNGELAIGPRGWFLTARQELHAEELPELHQLMSGLATHSSPVRPVGHLRFHEDDVPDLLVVRSGTIVREQPHPASRPHIPFLEGLT